MPQPARAHRESHQPRECSTGPMWLAKARPGQGTPDGGLARSVHEVVVLVSKMRLDGRKGVSHGDIAVPLAVPQPKDLRSGSGSGDDSARTAGAGGVVDRQR